MTTDRPRCTAKNNRGEPCGRAPIKGGSVCPTHGGRAPQVKAAAEQRQLEDKAGRELAKIWAGLDQAVPVTDPVASLARLAGALEQAVDKVGAKVNGLGHIGGGAGLTQMRAEVVLLERLLGQLRQALDAMARLGIAERHVELEQERAQLVSSAFLAALGVVSLLPADRDAMLRAFLSGIGRGPEVLEQGGGA